MVNILLSWAARPLWTPLMFDAPSKHSATTFSNESPNLRKTSFTSSNKVSPSVEGVEWKPKKDSLVSPSEAYLRQTATCSVLLISDVSSTIIELCLLPCTLHIIRSSTILATVESISF